MKIVALFIFCVAPFLITAQVIKPVLKPPTPKPIVKGKVPVITASIGGMTSGKYGVGAAKILIDSNLVLKDEKGQKYVINRCSFMYKRKMTYTDEESGQKRITWEYLAKELRNGEQLDKFWRDTIKEDLKVGEELIFEKILADSKKGYMIPVKGLSITVK